MTATARLWYDYAKKHNFVHFLKKNLLNKTVKIEKEINVTNDFANREIYMES